MNNIQPRVSIALPVFNGENYLAVALDSILGQTFSDFELVILDNASTDRTEEICRQYAEADQRIRYCRNQTNIGGPRNFNRVFELCTGEYFKWAHHDDVLAPEFLAKCVAVLDRDPSLILVHCKTARIEDDGRVVGSYDHDMQVDAPEPAKRFHDLLTIRHWCFEQFGLLRSRVLKKVPLHGTYVASDRRLMAELALLGRWYIIPEYLFYRRQHAEACSNIWPMQARMAWFDPARAGRISFPYFKETAEYLKVLHRVPLKWRTRLHCYSTLARYAQTNKRGFLLDLQIAAVTLLHRTKLGRGLIALSKRVTQNRISALPQ
jgi:glycosyltransferase involved in cell wall biosynthesis